MARGEAIASASNRKYETATVLQKQDSVEMLFRIEALTKLLHFSDFQRLSPFQFASCFKIFKSVSGCHRRNQKWPVDG